LIKELVLSTLAAGGTLAMAAIPVAAADGDTVTMEGNTDRMGGDYRRIDASPSVESCHSACVADKDCDAYTYVKSAHHCWLKRGTPPATPNNDTVSGVKKRPVGGGSCATVDGVTCEPNTDRMGGDYRRIEAAPSVQFCQNQCAAEAKCASYTYVRSAFHCWLKGVAPNATPNADTVSGVRIPGSAPASPSAPATVPSGGDELEGRWVFGPGGESWTLTRLERNRYKAQESGFANASGIATVNGDEFRLDFTFPGGSGHYLGRIGPGARQIETTRHPDGARFTFVRP
jgi:hypothetical protein